MRALPAPTPRSTWAPLPAIDLPIAAAYPTLKARADQGDASAACRLAAELDWCATRLDWIQSAPSDRRMAVIQELDPDNHCSGLQPNAAKDRLHYLRQAALAGNLDAMANYVSAYLMMTHPDLAADYLEAYAWEAPKLAEAGVKAGSVQMLNELALSYGRHNRFSWLSRATNQTWQQSRLVVLQELSRLVSGRPMAPGSGNPAAANDPAMYATLGLSADAVAKLRAQAAAWHQEWFQGKPKYPGVSTYTIKPSGNRRPDFNLPCSDGFIDAPLQDPGIAWPDA
ncbi:hypothetical protein [Ahniella affigens]|nr:hypothetical protein [Ahniella affigens]